VGIDLVHGVDHKADHTRCNIRLTEPVYLIPAQGADYVESPIPGHRKRVAWSTQYRDWTCPGCGGRAKVPEAPTATNLRGGRALLATLAAACFVVAMLLPARAAAAEPACAGRSTTEIVLAFGLLLALGAAVALGIVVNLQRVDVRTAQEQGGRAALDLERAQVISETAVDFIRALRASDEVRAEAALARLRRAVPGEGA
jgi:hypothetical protein